MTRPNVSARRVIVEYADGDWIAMIEAGDVRIFETPADVVAWIKRADARTARAGADITATIVEWRNTPPGFIQPDPT